MRMVPRLPAAGADVSWRSIRRPPASAAALVELNNESLEYRERGLRAAAHLAPGEVDRLDGGGLYRRLRDRGEPATCPTATCTATRSSTWPCGCARWAGSSGAFPVDAVTHYGHDAPPYQLLMRRWRARYVCGLGELRARRRGRSPSMRLVLRGARELRIYTAVLAWWAVLAGVPFLPLPLPRAPPRSPRWPPRRSLLMLWRKRSLARAAYSVVSWCFNAAGLVRGLLSPAPPAARAHPQPRDPGAAAGDWNAAASITHETALHRTADPRFAPRCWSSGWNGR